MPSSMLDDAVRAVIAEEGSAAIATVGSAGPHLTATWQSYIEILDGQTVAFPAGGLRQTEANVAAGSPIFLLLAAKNPAGLPKPTGFRLTGHVTFESGTPLHERLKSRFPWCRAAVILRVTEVKKVLG